MGKSAEESVWDHKAGLPSVVVPDYPVRNSYIHRLRMPDNQYVENKLLKSDTHSLPIQLDAGSIIDALQGVYKGKAAFRRSEDLLERFGRRLNTSPASLEVCF